MKEKGKRGRNRWQGDDRNEKEGTKEGGKEGKEGRREGRKKGKALDVIIRTSVLLDMSQCIESQCRQDYGMNKCTNHRRINRKHPFVQLS